MFQFRRERCWTLGLAVGTLQLILWIVDHDPTLPVARNRYRCGDQFLQLLESLCLFQDGEQEWGRMMMMMAMTRMWNFLLDSAAPPPER